MINYNENENESKKKSHRYDISRSRPWHGHRSRLKYSKCLGMMMFTYINQCLWNIWGLIHKNVKQHWGWTGLQNKVCIKI